MPNEKETRKLECKVSKAEVEDRKNRLVVVDRQISTEITEKREEMAKRNTVIRELREEQENLVSAIEHGIEARDIECFWKMNDRLHKKELIRADTGAVVDETAQTLADKQEDLFDAGKGKKPAEESASDSGIVDNEYGKPEGKPKAVKVKGRGKKSRAEQPGA